MVKTEFRVLNSDKKIVGAFTLASKGYNGPSNNKIFEAAERLIPTGQYASYTIQRFNGLEWQYSGMSFGK